MDKLPWDLSVLTNLQELDLSMNLYTMVPDQCIWKGGHLATSLTKLSMNQNRIGQLPNEICEMKKLHTLSLLSPWTEKPPELAEKNPAPTERGQQPAGNFYAPGLKKPHNLLKKLHDSLKKPQGKLKKLQHDSPPVD